MKKQGEIRIHWNGYAGGHVTVYEKCMTGDIPQALALATVQILRDIAADGHFTTLLHGYIAGMLMEARESQGETVKIDLSGVKVDGADI